MKKKQISDRQWKEEALALLRGYAPPLRTCVDCGHPVIKGYQCTFCGSTEPTRSVNKEA